MNEIGTLNTALDFRVNENGDIYLGNEKVISGDLGWDIPGNSWRLATKDSSICAGDFTVKTTKEYPIFTPPIIKIFPKDTAKTLHIFKKTRNILNNF